MNMNRVIDLVMTKLFQLAEYVCSRCSSVMDEPAAKHEMVKQTTVPTIRFSSDEKYVEGELFN